MKETHVLSSIIGALVIGTAVIYGLWLTHNANCLWALILIPNSVRFKTKKKKDQEPKEE